MVGGGAHVYGYIYGRIQLATWVSFHASSAALLALACEQGRQWRSKAHLLNLFRSLSRTYIYFACWIPFRGVGLLAYGAVLVLR